VLPPFPSTNRLPGRLAAKLAKLWNGGMGFAIAGHFTDSFWEPFTSHKHARIPMSSIAESQTPLRC